MQQGAAAGSCLADGSSPRCLGCRGSRARLLLAQGQRWETLPAPRSPSAGLRLRLRREVTRCVRKAVPCPAHGDYLLGLMKEQFSPYAQQAPVTFHFPITSFTTPTPPRPVPVSNTIYQVKHGKRNRQGRSTAAPRGRSPRQLGGRTTEGALARTRGAQLSLVVAAEEVGG